MAEAAVLVVAGLMAAGQVYQAEQQGKAMDAEADQAKLNAITARQQGAAAEEAQRRENRMKLGYQRAAAAESGFDPNTGSLAMLQVKSAGEVELDALTARYQGTLQGLGLENQAKGLRSQASATRFGGYLSAAGTLASAAGGYYGGATKISSGGGGYYMNGGGAGF
jgi:hypothetical protein